MGTGAMHALQRFGGFLSTEPGRDGSSNGSKLSSLMTGVALLNRSVNWYRNAES